MKHREHLWRRIAWRIQEQRFGGLSTVAKRKLDALITEIDIPLVVEGAEPKKPVLRVNGEPQVGTTLPRAGRIRQARPAARFSKTPAGLQRSAPMLGEHTREALIDLGYSDADIDRLLADGVAGVASGEAAE